MGILDKGAEIVGAVAAVEARNEVNRFNRFNREALSRARVGDAAFTASAYPGGAAFIAFTSLAEPKPCEAGTARMARTARTFGQRV